ncbi:MAG: FkbM family methyltransferase [Bacteroidales bacterium]|nr:FkbM family methyltransferase [Bacteroidales bacterium]
MFNYLKTSLNRRAARRITREYPVRTDTFETEKYGRILFANWENPLVERKEIDQKSLSFYEKFIKEGDFALDIGANIGHMTVPLSLICGKTGLTLGFDPNPYVFKILEQNASLNSSISNTKVFNFAITDADDEYYYNSSEASFCNGGISKEKISRHGKFALSHKIKGVRLESFLNETFPDRLPNLRLIKIDTEGYDKEIIRSISNLLKQYKPAVITECFGKNSEKDRFEHFELLKSQGYSLYYFSGFSIDAEIVPILKKEDMLKWRHFDFYAVQED